MASPPQKKDKRETVVDDGAFYVLPDVNLINQQQWEYIKRRYHLSPRELEVAKLICRGLTNREIASDLKVRPGTAKIHLKHIFHKARTRNKIATLLRFIGDVNEFFGESASAPDIRIIDIEKPGKKTADSAKTSKKDK